MFDFFRSFLYFTLFLFFLFLFPQGFAILILGVQGEAISDDLLSRGRASDYLCKQSVWCECNDFCSKLPKLHIQTNTPESTSLCILNHSLTLFDQHERCRNLH